MLLIRPVFISFLALTALMLAATAALALDLQAARSQGLVGEHNGYIEPIKPSPEVRALIDDINARRRQEYLRISSENGQPIDVVAKLAAEQIINKLPEGSKYKINGEWKSR